MKTKTIALIVLFCVMSTGVIYYKFHGENRHFSCLAQYHVYNDGIRANMLMRFHFDDASGLVMLNGEFINEKGYHKVLSRKVLFDFEVNKEKYMLNSKAIIPAAFDETDDRALSRLLDGFYTQANQLALYEIYHNGNGDYIFMNGNLPVLICAET
jgi:hypothetical protein